MLSHSVHDADNGVAHLRVIVVEESAIGAVGDDEAHGKGIVSHDAREAIDGRSLHLEVGDLQAVPLERRNSGAPYGRASACGLQRLGS